jgi:hypothetical protein
MNKTTAILLASSLALAACTQKAAEAPAPAAAPAASTAPAPADQTAAAPAPAPADQSAAAPAAPADQAPGSDKPKNASQGGGDKL